MVVMIIIEKRLNKNLDVSLRYSLFSEEGFFIADYIEDESITKRRIYKSLVYNHDKKEWFVKEKIKLGNKKKVVWDTFYHDYHKMYFTTCV